METSVNGNKRAIMNKNSGAILWSGPEEGTIRAVGDLLAAGEVSLETLSIVPILADVVTRAIEVAAEPVTTPEPEPVTPEPEPVTLPTVTTPEPVTLPTVTTPEPVRSPSLTWDATSRGGEVVQSAATRAVSDAEYLATTLGIASAPPVYAPGAQLVGIGRQNLIRSHRAWRDSPRTLDGLRDLAARIEGERRSDRIVTTPIRTCPTTGRVLLPTGGAVSLEARAVEPLCLAHGLPRGSGALVQILTPEDRARVFDRYGSGETGEGTEVVLRTRDVPGTTAQRSVFGVVSHGYQPFDGDKLCRLVALALERTDGGAEARGEVYYDPESSRIVIDGTYHVDHTSNFGAGDYFKLGFRVTTSDNGGGSIRIRPVAWRNLCLNLIIIDEKAGTDERIVHRGDVRAMADRIARSIVRIQGAIRPFLARWGYVSETSATTIVRSDALGFAPEPEEVVQAWSETVAGVTLPRGEEDRSRVQRIRAVLSSEVGAPSETWGIPRSEVASAIERSWSAEPTLASDGYPSLASLLNAVTRIHAEPVPVPVVQLAEQHAGSLLRSLTPAQLARMRA